jgi:hypothetical protein
MKNFTNFYSWWQNTVHGNYIKDSEFQIIQDNFNKNESQKNNNGQQK